MIETREGSVRVRDTETGEWRMAEPGSMWFSTITMAAEEVFLRGRWEPIFPDAAQSASGDANV